MQSFGRQIKDVNHVEIDSTSIRVAATKSSSNFASIYGEYYEYYGDSAWTRRIAH
jgi:hypothetical protein